MKYILVHKRIEYIVDELNFCEHKWINIKEISADLKLPAGANASEYSVITKGTNYLAVESYNDWQANL